MDNPENIELRARHLGNQKGCGTYREYLIGQVLAGAVTSNYLMAEALAAAATKFYPEENWVIETIAERAVSLADAVLLEMARREYEHH
ncbi:hypothetical protein [Picosynechococcus sp. PCC 8807]|uniref:hypothetical protein n=1 Tax=Picosynechococcus sp. PCC 8807 TaxID=195248 RepID=UPI000810AEAF|nr:hypothetical protein [Picosynechococcus sp. PCC 8807]ANV90881.1 hypothetical protein AWQ24_09685 [Picosynechococcus sp. PCC 8807]